MTPEVLPFMRTYKRSKRVVDRSLQYQMTGVFLLGVLISLLIFTTGIIGYYWMRSIINPSEEFLTVRTSVEKEATLQENGETRIEKYMVSEESPPLRPYEYIAPIILLNNFIILIVLGFMGIIYSHRIAGPIYNINRALDLAASGELHREIRLRQGDFFQETASKLNKILPLTRGVDSLKDRTN